MLKMVIFAIFCDKKCQKTAIFQMITKSKPENIRLYDWVLGVNFSKIGLKVLVTSLNFIIPGNLSRDLYRGDGKQERRFFEHISEST